MTKFLFSLLCILILNFSTVYSNSGYITFPGDSMMLFTEKYGVDSLKKILDDRIQKTEKFLLESEIKEDINIISLKFLLMSKHFNNGLDTLIKDRNSNKIPFYYLYTEYYGDTTVVSLSKTVSYSEESRNNIKYELVERNREMVLGSLKNNIHTNNLLTTFCDFFGEDLMPHVDSIVKYYFKDLEPDNYTEYFFNLATLSRNCGHLFPEFNQRYDSVFNHIYDRHNIVNLYKDTVIYEVYDEEFIDATLPMIVLAYAIYSQNFDANKYSADLMLFLNLFDESTGSWLRYRKEYEQGMDYFNSMLALWILNEWYNHLN